jgi:hypothetical protein
MANPWRPIDSVWQGPRLPNPSAKAEMEVLARANVD